MHITNRFILSKYFSANSLKRYPSHIKNAACKKYSKCQGNATDSQGNTIGFISFVYNKLISESENETAVIELIADEANSTLKIKVNHTKNIEKVIYKWGTNREKELKHQEV